MLESKDHWQNIDSSGALDLTFALRACGPWGSERQIRSVTCNLPPETALSKDNCGAGAPPVANGREGVLVPNPKLVQIWNQLQRRKLDRRF
jgi:hypothetical protein